MDFLESGRRCHSCCMQKASDAIFSVFPIFSNVFTISSNLFWQHIMNFDIVHFGCSGFFARAMRDLLNSLPIEKSSIEAIVADWNLRPTK